MTTQKTTGDLENKLIGLNPNKALCIGAHNKNIHTKETSYVIVSVNLTIYKNRDSKTYMKLADN